MTCWERTLGDLTSFISKFSTCLLNVKNLNIPPTITLCHKQSQFCSLAHVTTKSSKFLAGIFKREKSIRVRLTNDDYGHNIINVKGCEYLIFQYPYFDTYRSDEIVCHRLGEYSKVARNFEDDSRQNKPI